MTLHQHFHYNKQKRALGQRNCINTYMLAVKKPADRCIKMVTCFTEVSLMADLKVCVRLLNIVFCCVLFLF